MIIMIMYDYNIFLRIIYILITWIKTISLQVIFKILYQNFELKYYHHNRILLKPQNLCFYLITYFLLILINYKLK